MTKAIDVFFADLSEEKQKEILEAFKIEKPEDMNWDVFPLAIINVEVD